MTHDACGTCSQMVENRAEIFGPAWNGEVPAEGAAAMTFKVEGSHLVA